MNGTGDRLIEVMRRRERLIARAEAQRAAVREGFGGLRGPISVVDRGIAAGRYLRSNPLVLVAGVAVLAAFRRRGVLSLAGRAFAVWRTWRAVRSWAGKMGV